MARMLLALDQGTTSSRAVLFHPDGRLGCVAQREFKQHFPASGWVEHDAEEIWTSQIATAIEVLKTAGAASTDVAALGITNQRETIVLWDRASGKAIAPAIVWQDRRTAGECERLRSLGHEPAVTETTGLRLDPYFSATKLAWLLDNIPGARGRAERGELAAGTIDSWLIFRLTEGTAHVTDVSNASRTLLVDLRTGQWSQAMLDLFRIPRACLPAILPSSIGGSEAPVATFGGLRLPIRGIAGDQQAALFGQACFRPGMAKNTYGTGCFTLINTGTAALPSRHRLLSTIAWDTGQRSYALEGSVFVGGAVVQWLRDGLGIIASAGEVEGLARSVPDAGGVYVVPAFTGLGAPYWDPHARGAIVGLTRGTNRAHLARAALESIAFQSAEVLNAMQQDAGSPLVELRVDGGGSVNDLLMQIQADLLGVPVLRPTITETTALGAAYLAGLGAGIWDTQDELAAGWQVERRFEPEKSGDWAAGAMSAWRRAVDRSLRWAD
jgi:glycerol kinase